MIPTILHYSTRAEQAADLAEIVAADLAAAIARKGRATLAVPGGTTPGPFLTELAKAGIDWASVSVMLTDERFVPESSDRSNTRLLRQVLMQGPAAAATLVPFYAPADQPEDVVPALTEAISAVLPLDVCVLGMGEDMHTASIFPGADRLEEALSAVAPVLIPMRAPGAPEPRLTLSAPVLRAAPSLHLLITGPAKRTAFEAALKADTALEAPVRAVLTGPNPITTHYAD